MAMFTLSFKTWVNPSLACFLNGFIRFTSGATPADLKDILSNNAETCKQLSTMTMLKTRQYGAADNGANINKDP